MPHNLGYQGFAINNAPPMLRMGARFEKTMV